MNPADAKMITRLPGLDFALGETLDMLRETVQHFAAAEMTQEYGRSGMTSKAFTCFDRRGAMVETKAEKVHAR